MQKGKRGGREKLQHPDVLQGLRESRKLSVIFILGSAGVMVIQSVINLVFKLRLLDKCFCSLFLSWLLGQQFLQESPATSSRRFQGLQGQDGKSDPFSSSRWSPPSRTCPKHLPGESAGNIRPNTPLPPDKSGFSRAAAPLRAPGGCLSSSLDLQGNSSRPPAFVISFFQSLPAALQVDVLG